MALPGPEVHRDLGSTEDVMFHDLPTEIAAMGRVPDALWSHEAALRAGLDPASGAR